MKDAANDEARRVMILLPSIAAGGAERVAVHLANYWSQTGWVIRIVTISDLGNDFYHLAKQVERVGLALDTESATTIEGVIQNSKRLWAIRRQIKLFKPHIAIGMMTACSVLIGLASIACPGVRAIGSERVHPPRFPLSRIWEIARRYFYSYLRCVVVLAPESATWLFKNTRVRAVRVIGNPVVYPLPGHEASSATADPAFSDARQRRLLLAIGRLDNQKGFDLLIQAFANCAAIFSSWNLVILGQGGDRLKLQALVEAANLQDRVYLPGVVGNVGAWFSRADLFVLSSRFEGFPNTLLEAMACGLAVVSFDCETGPSMLIRNETNGLLVPPEDVAALSASLLRLMGDDALRTRLGREAKLVRHEYSIESVARKWELLFEEIES